MLFKGLFGSNKDTNYSDESNGLKSSEIEIILSGSRRIFDLEHWRYHCNNLDYQSLIILQIDLVLNNFKSPEFRKFNEILLYAQSFSGQTAFSYLENYKGGGKHLNHLEEMELLFDSISEIESVVEKTINPIDEELKALLIYPTQLVLNIQVRQANRIYCLVLEILKETKENPLNLHFFHSPETWRKKIFNQLPEISSSHKFISQIEFALSRVTVDNIVTVSNDQSSRGKTPEERVEFNIHPLSQYFNKLIEIRASLPNIELTKYKRSFFTNKPKEIIKALEHLNDTGIWKTSYEERTSFLNAFCTYEDKFNRHYNCVIFFKFNETSISLNFAEEFIKQINSLIKNEDILDNTLCDESAPRVTKSSIGRFIHLLFEGKVPDMSLEKARRMVHKLPKKRKMKEKFH